MSTMMRMDAEYLKEVDSESSQTHPLPSPCSAICHRGLTLVNPPCQLASG